MLFGLCGIRLVFVKVVFGCSHVSEGGDELISATKNRAGKRVMEQYETKEALIHRTWFGLSPSFG